jgi:hypothetical protein
VKGELDSLLEEWSTWPTEEVLIDAYFKNESGEEVKKTLDICAHIRCSKNDRDSK